MTTLVVVTCFFFVWSANPVHGVLTLVVVGLALAGLLLREALEFPALLIVLVYVGAVTVLFIFVVIMVNLRATPVSYLTAESYTVWGLLSFTVLGSFSNLAGGVVSNPVVLAVPHVEAHLNLATLGFLLYGTERVYAVFLVGLVLFIAMIAAICLSLVGGENYRTQEFYSQIRRSNAVFTLSTKSL
uniref:NADH-ubiquinone oxidoreductase chain 6 n=1 Tax=Protostelium mycophagum TaxID=472931 RepID=A0A290YM06_9EUKA|nr:NADH dehydrogenase subunit 6 [Protostelium mycophagum]